MFKEAKEQFLTGINILMEVKWMTSDDPAYNEKIKKWIHEVMDWAELCKTQMDL